MKHKLKIELVYWSNERGSYNGYTLLNGQPFRFFNVGEEDALNKLISDTKSLCEEMKKKQINR